MKLRTLLILCATSNFCFQTVAVAQTPPTINSFTVDESDILIGGSETFRYDVSGADTLSIDQGVGEVSGSSTRISPGSRFDLVPLDATWKFFSYGSNLGASDIVVGNPAYGPGHWKHPSYDDSDWLEGPALLGYGDTVATEVGFFSLGGDKNLTTYFRHTFSITAAEIAALENLFLEFLRDDSLIVYLNGKEMVRSNFDEDVVTFRTSANATVAGAEETAYFLCTLSTGDLVPGENTIAVEAHQVNPGSSDLSFGLGLFDVRTVASTTLFPAGSDWLYLDDGSNLGLASEVAGSPGFSASNWKHPGFDDDDWSTGDGEFGYLTELVDEATIIRFGPNEDNADNDSQNKFLAYYFRTTFQIVDNDELFSIFDAMVNLRADDGAIVYINGYEVARDGILSESEMTSTTPADAATGVDENAYDPFSVAQNPSAILQTGTNVVAVEVHQVSATSSDVSFDMDLILTTFDGEQDVFVSKLARGSSWRYLDDGGATLNDSSSDTTADEFGFDSSNWKHFDYDDSLWRSGNAELGYGDTGLTIGGNGGGGSFETLLAYGGDPANKFPTTYFRKDFTVVPATVNSATGARMRVRVDDGAIVYVNGTEVWRKNLPSGVDGETLASAESADDGVAFQIVSFDKSVLVGGANTVAVELHQASADSPDAVFDMAMDVVAPQSSVTYRLTASNQFGSDTATVDVNSVPVPGGSVYLQTPNFDSIDWLYPEVWSDKQAPHAGNYIVYGQYDGVVMTPNEDDPVFGGSSLELHGAGSALRLDHNAGTTAAIPIIRLSGGEIVNASGDSVVVGGSGNTIVVSRESSIRNDAGAQILEVSANLSGSGSLKIAEDPAPADPPVPTGVLFTGNNSGFSGTWIVDGPLRVGSATALGLAEILVSGTGVLDAETDIENVLNNVLAFDAGATLILDQILRFVSGNVRIAGNVVPDGNHTAAALTAMGFGGTFVDGGGVLVIGGANSDSDGDNLLDAWELIYYPNLTATDGTGDTDGDGQTEAAEFASGTDPTDPFDVLEVSSVTQDAGSGDVIIRWPSKSGVSYRVRFGDLQNWTVIGAAMAGTGAEMSFTDDGSLTGGAPGTDTERYYQVIVVGQ